MDAVDSIGSVIRKARKEHGLTQKQLGAKAKLSHATICHMEYDRTIFGKPSLSRVAKVLNLDFKDLMSRRNKLTLLSNYDSNKLCEQIDLWYLKWKDKIVDNKQPHRFGIAKEDLKSLLTDPHKKHISNLIDDIMKPM